MTVCATVTPFAHHTVKGWRDDLVPHLIPGAAMSQGTPKHVHFSTYGHNTKATKVYFNQKQWLQTGIHQNTVFEAGSLSKTLVSYLVYRLETLKLIQPNTPLMTQLSDDEQWALLLADIKDPRSRQRAGVITYEMLLTHSAGFKSWRGNNPLRIGHEPDERFHYSGEGYLFLQRFLEIYFNTDIETLFKDYVFKPIGLKRSSFSCPELELEDELAFGHDRHGRTLPKFTASKPVIAGSLHTTLTEYTRFIEHLLSCEARSKHYFDWVQRRTQTTAVFDVQWAQGWGTIRDESGSSRFFWHWGDTGGYNCFVALDVYTKQFFTYFTNSQNGLLILQQLFQQSSVPFHRQSVSSIKTFINAVTNPVGGFERYWFDYDQKESFLTANFGSKTELPLTLQF